MLTSDENLIFGPSTCFPKFRYFYPTLEEAYEFLIFLSSAEKKIDKHIFFALPAEDVPARNSKLAGARISDIRRPFSLSNNVGPVHQIYPAILNLPRHYFPSTLKVFVETFFFDSCRALENLNIFATLEKRIHCDIDDLGSGFYCAQTCCETIYCHLSSIPWSW